jgi:DNA processing protein
MNEREAYIALNMMAKVGPVGVRSLVAVLGSAQAIFDCPRDGLLKAGGVGPELAKAILAQRETLDWQGEIDRAAQAGIRIVAQVDVDYPDALRTIHDPPLALYVRGTLAGRDRHAIAIVGTRHPTHYGSEVAERLGAQLAQAGFTVVSGLAEGIDTRAHAGALKANGRTLAVIGGGMDCLYPPSNRDLADRIAGHGAVLSEFPLGRQPDRTTFAIRNRIVSGLSKGVVVVEAGLKSGALITANQALDQGRNVFAVPGRIDSNPSQGCHALIRKGAALVTSVDDILEGFEFLLDLPAGQPERGGRQRPALTAEEESVVQHLEGGGQDVDGLIRLSGLHAAGISSLLLTLEMKRVVKMLPGRRVELVRL